MLNFNFYSLYFYLGGLSHPWFRHLCLDYRNFNAEVTSEKNMHCYFSEEKTQWGHVYTEAPHCANMTWIYCLLLTLSSCKRKKVMVTIIIFFLWISFVHSITCIHFKNDIICECYLPLFSLVLSCSLNPNDYREWCKENFFKLEVVLLQKNNLKSCLSDFIFHFLLYLYI